jgi:peptidyl-prolyl cis-trans isomerase D
LLILKHQPLFYFNIFITFAPHFSKPFIMAIIGEIRKRSTFLLIIIGGSLLLFIWQLAKPDNSQGGNGRRNKIKPLAEVYNTELNFREFDFEIQRQIALQKERNPEYSPAGMELFNLRQQLYQSKVKEFIYLNHCKKLGLAIDNEYSSLPAISSAEFRDMLLGTDPHPEIKRAFTNPNTGQFDAAQVKNVLDNQDQLDAVQKVQWMLFLEEIKKERLSEKYKNLVLKSSYLPTALAKLAYHDSKDQVSFRLVAKRYETINDSVVKVGDEDYKKYYEEHKKEYDRDAQATVNYAVFEAKPSKSDIAAIEQRFNSLVEGFRISEDPAAFVLSNSHDKYDSTWFKKGMLPPVLDSVLFNAPKGTLYGPFIDGTKFKAGMVTDAMERPDSMRASHILIAYKGAERAGENVTRLKEEAQAYADSLYKAVKATPSLFENLASTISDDAYARTTQGDLKWFNENSMARPFSDACLTHKEGDLVLTETSFGYHIIKVTGKKDFSKQVRVAILTNDIEPSKETIASEFARASRFVNGVNSLESFENGLEKEGISGVEAIVSKEMYTVQTLQDGREIVRWTFDEETEPGKTTKMFEFPDKYQYVICIVKSRREKGIWELDEDLKKNLEPLVKREKKHDMIAAEMKKTGTTDLYQIASKMGLTVDTANISFNMTNLISYGPEGGVIGTAFGLPKGKVSEPIKGIISTFMIVVDEKVVAEEAENLLEYKMNEDRLYQQLIQQSFDKALEKAANVVDNRLMWF